MRTADAATGPTPASAQDAVPGCYTSGTGLLQWRDYMLLSVLRFAGYGILSPHREGHKLHFFKKSVAGAPVITSSLIVTISCATF